MSELFLNDLERRAFIQHLECSGVSQPMGVYALHDSALLADIVHECSSPTGDDG